MQDSRLIVGIHGAPRSGTSWLGQLFNSHPQVAYRYQPFFSYAFRGRIEETSSASDIRRCFDDLLTTEDAFVHQTGAARLARSLPEFTKSQTTHLVYKEVRFHNLIGHILATLPETKFIGIIRDPRAVLASWFAAPREFNREWAPEEEWRFAGRKNAGLQENWYGFERWKQLTELFLAFKERYPNRFHLVRYEDLVGAPESIVAALFDFCGLRYVDQTANFIERSTTHDDEDAYGVFRKHGEAGLVRLLPVGITEQIEQQVTGTSLAQFLSGPAL